MDFFKVKSFEEAKDTVKKIFSIERLSTEILPLTDAVGRRAAKDIFSAEDLPDYNRSVVDGYAIRAANAYGATDSVPSMLKLIGKVEMGVVGGFEVKSGEAVYVPTGGAVPRGADAMVMLEDVEPFGDYIAVYKPVALGANLIKIGDDVEKGDRLLCRGELITPLKCGSLAACGAGKVEVFRKIRVAVISTGDEIVGIEDKTEIGQIRDVNTVVNSALCRENNFEIVTERRVKDDFSLLENAVIEGVNTADLVIVSGGSSIGAKDFTEKVIEKNGEILVHGIALKPGKPTLIGKIASKPVFGLPGHPMACLLTLKLLVLGSINECFGKENESFVFAETAINFPSAPGRLTIQPVELEYFENRISANPVFYKSGLVSVLARADGYVLIPPNAEGVEKGKRIKVYLL